MADLWDHLFDNEWKQRDDIERAWSSADVALDSVAALRSRLEATEARAERLELTVEALVTLLQTRGQLDRHELSIMIQRVDLADGLEDGRIGPDNSRRVPACGACGRPRNPRRTQCLYCGALAEQAAAERPPTPTLACRTCGEQVAENQVYFTEHGMVCEVCFAG